jgi:thioredoxin-like negative regulator of GroEL
MNDRNFDRLKQLLADERYTEAINLLARINEKHAKTASDFIALARTYGKRGDFPRAEKMFKKAYRIRPSKLLYHEVLDVCLETGHLKDAEEYLAEYEGLPSHDEYSCAIYRYKILKRKGAGRDEIIGALEKINAADYTEKWAYELAKQYYKAGNEAKCKAECKKIIKTFEVGQVAAKAKMLLAYYNGDVSADDIKKSLSSRKKPADETPANNEAVPEESAAPVEGENGFIFGLEDIARGVQDIIDGEKNSVEAEAQPESGYTETEAGDIGPETTEFTEEETAAEEFATGEPITEEFEAEKPETEKPETEEYSEEEPISGEFEEEELTEEESEDEAFTEEPAAEETAAAEYAPEEFATDAFNLEMEEIRAEQPQIIPENISAGDIEEETEETVGAENTASFDEENDEERPRFETEWFTAKFKDDPVEETHSDPVKFLSGEIGKQRVSDEDSDIDDEEDIIRGKRSKSLVEEGFMWELNSRRFERSMPQYVLYAPKMNYSKSEIREGVLRTKIIEKGVDLEGICKNYFRIDDLRRSILKSLELAFNEKGALCYIITGEEKSGKTTLAFMMIHILHMLGILNGEKTAKIRGEKLNRINLYDRAESLKDCNILIENAGALSSDSLRDLVEIFGQKKKGICLILEDNMRNMNALFRNNDRFNGKFNNRLHLPKYGTDELMGFAYDVFNDADFAIEASAAENFKKLIMKKTQGTEEKLPIVLELAKEAVDNADKRLTPEILKMAAEAAIENYNLVILNEDLRL